MSWLALFFALEVGFLPMGFIGTYFKETPIGVDLQGSGYVDIDLEFALFQYAFIGGGVKTYIYRYSNSRYFSPATVEYDFRAGLRFEPLELGFRHYCAHPVVPWVYFREISPQWEGGYEELYLRLEVSK